MMRLTFILLIGIDFCCYGQRIPILTAIDSDHIRIDHIGENDKPFPSLVITTVPLKLQVEEWEILVSREVFSHVQNEITTSTLLHDTLPKYGEYGTFKIVVLKEGKRLEYFLWRRSDSIEFLKKLKASIIGKETAQQLTSQIDYLNRRIDIAIR